MHKRTTLVDYMEFLFSHNREVYLSICGTMNQRFSLSAVRGNFRLHREMSIVMSFDVLDYSINPPEVAP